MIHEIPVINLSSQALENLACKHHSPITSRITATLSQLSSVSSRGENDKKTNQCEGFEFNSDFINSPHRRDSIVDIKQRVRKSALGREDMDDSIFQKRILTMNISIPCTNPPQTIPGPRPEDEKRFFKWTPKHFKSSKNYGPKSPRPPSSRAKYNSLESVSVEDILESKVSQEILRNSHPSSVTLKIQSSKRKSHDYCENQSPRRPLNMKQKKIVFPASHLNQDENNGTQCNEEQKTKSGNFTISNSGMIARCISPRFFQNMNRYKKEYRLSMKLIKSSGHHDEIMEDANECKEERERSHSCMVQPTSLAHISSINEKESIAPPHVIPQFPLRRPLSARSSAMIDAKYSKLMTSIQSDRTPPPSIRSNISPHQSSSSSIDLNHFQPSLVPVYNHQHYYGTNSRYVRPLSAPPSVSRREPSRPAAIGRISSTIIQEGSALSKNIFPPSRPIRTQSFSNFHGKQIGNNIETPQESTTKQQNPIPSSIPMGKRYSLGISPHEQYLKREIVESKENAVDGSDSSPPSETSNGISESVEYVSNMNSKLPKENLNDFQISETKDVDVPGSDPENHGDLESNIGNIIEYEDPDDHNSLKLNFTLPSPKKWRDSSSSLDLSINDSSNRKTPPILPIVDEFPPSKPRKMKNSRKLHSADLGVKRLKKRKKNSGSNPKKGLGSGKHSSRNYNINTNNNLNATHQITSGDLSNVGLHIRSFTPRNSINMRTITFPENGQQNRPHSAGEISRNSHGQISRSSSRASISHRPHSAIPPNEQKKPSFQSPTISSQLHATQGMVKMRKNEKKFHYYVVGGVYTKRNFFDY